LDGKTLLRKTEYYQNITRQSSVFGSSVILEAFPALLSYVVSQIFVHARLAEESRADPRSIIERLGEQGEWARLVALTESINHETGLLYYAASQGLSSWVTSVISLEPGLNGFKGESPLKALLEASTRGDKRAFSHLLSTIGWDPSYEQPVRNPILHLLALESDPSYVKMFLDAVEHWKLPDGSSRLTRILNRRNSKHRTVLEIAVRGNCLDIARELLRHGTRIDPKNQEEQTVLQVA
jgi:hypothetical protein